MKALSDLHSKRNILLRAMLKLIAQNKLAGLRVVMADALYCAIERLEAIFFKSRLDNYLKTRNCKNLG